jgi:hypothetical protein
MLFGIRYSTLLFHMGLALFINIIFPPFDPLGSVYSFLMMNIFHLLLQRFAPRRA